MQVSIEIRKWLRNDYSENYMQLYACDMDGDNLDHAVITIVDSNDGVNNDNDDDGDGACSDNGGGDSDHDHDHDGIAR